MDQAARIPDGGRQDRIERWFVTQGVPRLVEGYSVANWLPVLASLVFVLLAYQLAAAPLLGLEPRQLAVAPAVVILLPLPAVPVLRAAFDPGDPGTALTRDQIAWRLAPLGAAVALLLALIDSWVNVVALLLALFASAILLRRDVRTVRAAELDARRRRLAMVVVVAVLAFALEGLPLEPLWGGVARRPTHRGAELTSGVALSRARPLSVPESLSCDRASGDRRTAGRVADTDGRRGTRPRARTRCGDRSPAR